MRKLIQTKPIILAFCSLGLSGVIGLAGVSAQNASVQPPTTTSQPTADAKAPATVASVQVADNKPVRRGDRMVCKQDIILGTRLKGVRTCRTADDWRRISRGFQQKLKDVNDRGGAAFSGN